MMGIETIKAMAREAAQAAAEEGKTPFLYWNAEEVDQYENFPFPFLGDYVPEGWELVDEHFVDATGWGEEWEPALTIRAFKEIIKADLQDGWGVMQAGQFQVYVGQYRKLT